MYPNTVLGWFVGMMIIFIALLVLAALAIWADHRYQGHIEKNHGAPKDEEN